MRCITGCPTVLWTGIERGSKHLRPNRGSALQLGRCNGFWCHFALIKATNQNASPKLRVVFFDTETGLYFFCDENCTWQYDTYRGCFFFSQITKRCPKWTLLLESPGSGCLDDELKTQRHWNNVSSASNEGNYFVFRGVIRVLRFQKHKICEFVILSFVDATFNIKSFGCVGPFLFRPKAIRYQRDITSILGAKFVHSCKVNSNQSKFESAPACAYHMIYARQSR